MKKTAAARTGLRLTNPPLERMTQIPQLLRETPVLRSAHAEACPVCGSETDRLLYRLEAREIFWCEACGNGFDRSVVAAVDDEETYDDDYFSGVESGYNDYVSGAEQWRREARKRAAWVADRVPPPAQMLEIGSATGLFLDEAQKLGFDVTGVEVAPGAAQTASDLTGAEVRVGAFENQTDLQDGRFDVVCAWHTLEHITDPYPFLSAIRAALRPGGLFHCEVPNAGARTAAKQGNDWQMIHPGYHALHMTPAGIGNMLERAGFEVVVSESLWQAAYQPAAHRLRPDRLLRRAARALAVGKIGSTHAELGDFTRAVARA